MTSGLENLVKSRAAFRCEYCLIPQESLPTPFQIDHIIAKKHQGKTTPGNLALACYACNMFKGDNIAGIDSKSGMIVRLFHPRRHKWARHFSWRGPELVGKSPIGRATIHVLAINLPYRLLLRKDLIEEGIFPPN